MNAKQETSGEIDCFPWESKVLTAQGVRAMMLMNSECLWESGEME